jgi:acyl carrier protein
LDVKEFSVTDNFFDLGGNSLLAMQVLARIRKAFGVEVSVRSLFDGPSIDALGKAIEEAKAGGTIPRFPPLIPRPTPATGGDLLSAELTKLSPEQIEILLQQVRGGADAPSGRDFSGDCPREE